MQTTPVISPTGSGKSIRAFGEEVIVHLGGDQTDGAFALWTEITPPGGGPPPHYHEREDETFYVLEGRIAFFREGTWEEVPVGTVAYMPKNSVHTFKNVGDTSAKMLISTCPAGLEVFFARCADEFAKSGAPDMPRIIQISAEHGIHFVDA